jgi:hypothetical protein
VAAMNALLQPVPAAKLEEEAFTFEAQDDLR